LWPAYFDSARSWSEGRRVPLNLAVINPSVDEISDAARRLGLEAIVEADKCYPSTWWRREGRVLIRKVKGLSKTKIIRMVAEELIRIRSEKRSARK